MFIFIRILTDPAALLLWLLVNAMSQWLEVNVTICGHIMTERHWAGNVKLSGAQLNPRQWHPNATRGLWCILTLVYYCDWLGLSVAILGTCGRWPVMRILGSGSISGVAGHWWPLALIVPHQSWWHHTLTTSGAWLTQWACWPSASEKSSRMCE